MNKRMREAKKKKQRKWTGMEIKKFRFALHKGFYDILRFVCIILAIVRNGRENAFRCYSAAKNHSGAKFIALVFLVFLVAFGVWIFLVAAGTFSFIFISIRITIKRLSSKNCRRYSHTHTHTPYQRFCFNNWLLWPIKNKNDCAIWRCRMHFHTYINNSESRRLRIFLMDNPCLPVQHIEADNRINPVCK